MKNKKGFTLIELLAVIVILSIIMVIAIPQILNIISGVRGSAANSSIKLLKDAIKTQITASEMMGSNTFTKTDDCYVFDFDNKNSNYEALNLKNKDKFTGTLNYCSGEFSDNNLAYDAGVATGETQETKQYLYNAGNEYTSITGGWTLTNVQSHSRGEKLSDSVHLYISSVGSSGNTFETNNSINFSGYSKLYIKYKINNTYNTSENQYNCLWYWINGSSSNFISHVTPGDYTDVININNINSSKVSFSKYDADINIYQVWLEK